MDKLSYIVACFSRVEWFGVMTHDMRGYWEGYTALHSVLKAPMGASRVDSITTIVRGFCFQIVA